MGTPFAAQEFIAQHVRHIPRSGIRDFFDLVQGRPDIISLGVGEPDFVTPWHIREAAIYALERGRTTYTANLGLPKLREALSVSLAKNYSLTYHPSNQILITVGVSEALDIALRAIIDPGDEILYHEPCYVSYSPSITLAYGLPKPVSCRAENGFAVTAAAIEQARQDIIAAGFKPFTPCGNFRGIKPSYEKKWINGSDIYEYMPRYKLIEVRKKSFGPYYLCTGNTDLRALKDFQFDWSKKAKRLENPIELLYI